MTENTPNPQQTDNPITSGVKYGQAASLPKSKPDDLLALNEAIQNVSEATTWVVDKTYHVFMQQFAQVNNYAYSLKGDLSNRDGSIFKMGDSKKVTDVVAGKFDGSAFELFSYTSAYKTWLGTERGQRYFTIFQIPGMPSSLHLFLRAKTFYFDDPSFPYLGDIQDSYLALEGDFNHDFSLHVAKGQEMEALQIFTPDFMAKLQDDWKTFSLELVKDHIYIYSHLITTKAKLLSMYAFAKYIIDRVQPNLGKL